MNNSDLLVGIGFIAAVALVTILFWGITMGTHSMLDAIYSKDSVEVVSEDQTYFICLPKEK